MWTLALGVHEHCLIITGFPASPWRSISAPSEEPFLFPWWKFSCVVALALRSMTSVGPRAGPKQTAVPLGDGFSVIYNNTMFEGRNGTENLPLSFISQIKSLSSDRPVCAVQPLYSNRPRSGQWVAHLIFELTSRISKKWYSLTEIPRNGRSAQAWLGIWVQNRSSFCVLKRPKLTVSYSLKHDYSLEIFRTNPNYFAISSGKWSEKQIHNSKLELFFKVVSASEIVFLYIQSDLHFR